MGLGKLNPGCDSDCDEGCGFFCFGRKTATIRITGGTGCLADCNGDYIVPRFYEANTGEPNSPYVPGAGPGTCGYQGYAGANNTVPPVCIEDCYGLGLCSGGVSHIPVLNGETRVESIDAQQFRLIYRSDEGGQLLFTHFFRFWHISDIFLNFGDCCPMYPFGLEVPGRPCHWIWNWGFGPGGDLGFATGSMENVLADYVNVDDLRAEVYVGT